MSWSKECSSPSLGSLRVCLSFPVDPCLFLPWTDVRLFSPESSVVGTVVELKPKVGSLATLYVKTTNWVDNQKKIIQLWPSDDVTRKRVREEKFFHYVGKNWTLVGHVGGHGSKLYQRPRFGKEWRGVGRNLPTIKTSVVVTKPLPPHNWIEYPLWVQGKIHHLSILFHNPE